MRLTKADKIFMLTAVIAMSVFIPVYLYMNNHSAEARVSNLMNLGVTYEQARELHGDKDGIYSPALQLAVIGCTLFVVCIWFSGMIARSSKNLSAAPYDESWQKFLSISSTILFWLAMADIVLCLTRI